MCVFNSKKLLSAFRLRRLAWLNTLMKIKLLLSLLPAPLFALLGSISVYQGHSLCSAWPYEMSTMWFVMSLAHILPWIAYVEQRRLGRYSQVVVPVKQQ